MITRNTPQPAAPDAVALQWANGKTMARPHGGNARFAPYVGFHIEVGKDDVIDRALHGAETGQIEIKHQRPGGAEIVRHWAVAGEGDTLRFFPVTAGPVAETMTESVRRAVEMGDAGIGVFWGQGERSRLAVRGYLDTLVRAGCLRPVQLTTRSRMTDVLLACLLAHGRACTAADDLIDRARHPDVVCFHELALPLAAGEAVEWGTTDSTEVVPFACTHPATIDGAYLRTVWRPDGVHAAALRDWAGVVAWAQRFANQGDDASVRRQEPAYAEDRQ